MSIDLAISSYPSVYALGHKAIQGILEGEVVVSEKVDGSQFSFGVFDGEVACRSKGKQIVIDAPEALFDRAVETVKSLAPTLRDGWTYRGEYLRSPKHNTLHYARTPDRFLILFDVCTAPETYLSHEEMQAEATRIGLESVPLFFRGKLENIETLQAMVKAESCLGKATMEGVVVKNYNKFTPDKKVMMGKFVRDEFKEQHAKEWKSTNPGTADVVQFLVEKYKTPARFEKAIQHLRDAGKLEESPRDIGALMKEVPADVLKECEDEIREALFKHAWPKIQRGLTAGLPEFYKDRLAKAAFQGGTA